MSEHRQTVGEMIVGLGFNPSGDEAVVRVKRLFAQAIDELYALNKPRLRDFHPFEYVDTNQEMIATEAVNHIITAQMWAVKALTWKD